MYNPFVTFTEEILHALIKEGRNFLILQRFSWPGLSRANTFLITPYTDRESAIIHEHNLEHNEGKLLDISKESEKVIALLKAGNAYRLFLDKFKETNWNKRMLKEYQRNIVNYLRGRTRFTREDTIDINFVLNNGRLIAEIRAEDKSLDVPAYDLIK
ncbi:MULTISPECIES: hypothetical protein [Sphingobacterium]|uniref:hypothetical protein n=1 Tax=Sphingobacterium TaxID=28453 RepID=UPI0028A8FE71|nr:hypothetical protein [Sphingobacterium multivorum]